MDTNEQIREFNYLNCVELLGNGHEAPAINLVKDFLSQLKDGEKLSSHLSAAKFDNLLWIAKKQELHSFLNFLDEKQLANSNSSTHSLSSEEDINNGDVSMSKLENLRRAISDGNRKQAKKLILELADEYDLPNAIWSLFNNFEAKQTLLELARKTEDSIPLYYKGITKAVEDAINSVIQSKIDSNDYEFFESAIQKEKWNVINRFVESESFLKNLPKGKNPIQSLLKCKSVRLEYMQKLYDNLLKVYAHDFQRLCFFLNIAQNSSNDFNETPDIIEFIENIKNELSDKVSKKSIAVIGEKNCGLSTVLTTIKLLQNPPQGLCTIYILPQIYNKTHFFHDDIITPQNVGVSERCDWWMDFCKWINSDNKLEHTVDNLLRYFDEKLGKMIQEKGIAVKKISEPSSIEYNDFGAVLKCSQEDIKVRQVVFVTDYLYQKHTLSRKLGLDTDVGHLKIANTGQLYKDETKSKIFYGACGLYVGNLKRQTIQYCGEKIGLREADVLLNTIDTIIHSLDVVINNIGQNFASLNRINSQPPVIIVEKQMVI